MSVESLPYSNRIGEEAHADAFQCQFEQLSRVRSLGTTLGGEDARGSGILSQPCENEEAAGDPRQMLQPLPLDSKGKPDLSFIKPTSTEAVSYENRYLQRMCEDLRRLQVEKPPVGVLHPAGGQGTAAGPVHPGEPSRDSEKGSTEETPQATPVDPAKPTTNTGAVEDPPRPASTEHLPGPTGPVSSPACIGNSYHFAAAQKLLSAINTGTHLTSASPMGVTASAALFGPYGTLTSEQPVDPRTLHPPKPEVHVEVQRPPTNYVAPTPENAAQRPPLTSPTQQLFGPSGSTEKTAFLPQQKQQLHPQALLQPRPVFPSPAVVAGASAPSNSKYYLQQRNVYISGLPESFRPSAFRSMCDVFGRITSSKLCMEGENADRCKGYGFVLYQDVEAASTCIATLNGRLLDGKPLQVRRADLSAAPQPLDAVATATVSVGGPSLLPSSLSTPTQGSQQPQQYSSAPKPATFPTTTTASLSPRPATDTNASQPAPAATVTTTAAAAAAAGATPSPSTDAPTAKGSPSSFLPADLSRTIQEQAHQLQEQQKMIQQLLQLQQQQQALLMALGANSQLQQAPLAMPAPFAFPTALPHAALMPGGNPNAAVAPAAMSGGLPFPAPFSYAPTGAAVVDPSLTAMRGGFYPGLYPAAAASTPATAAYTFAPGVMNLSALQQQQQQQPVAAPSGRTSPKASTVL